MSPEIILTYALLAAAILALWLAPTQSGALSPILLPPWLLLGFFSVAAALWSGVVTPLGALSVLAFGAATYAISIAESGAMRGGAAIVVLLLAIALMLHRVPGFHNLRAIDAVKFTPDSVPFTLYLNFDKTVVGLFILGWCQTRITQRQEWRRVLISAAPWSAGVIALIMVLSLAAGYVRLAPKLPRESLLWLTVNLLFTCVAEEAFFRGFIQVRLQRAWAPYGRMGAGLALAVASAAFGAAHFGGGLMYVVLAAIAGWGYGTVFQRTGRIEASILTHFALNTVHFFLFTYPALSPSPA